MNNQIQMPLGNTNSIHAVDLTDEIEPLCLDEKIVRTTKVIKGLLKQGEHLLVSTSFGKDSSCMLNIFLIAMKEFILEHGSAPECLVVNSNTLVENPIMDAYARSEAKKVTAFCTLHNLPVCMNIVEPNLSNNYLVNIIGGRTIAVDAANDSKCSVMMKVNPITSHKNRVFKKYGKEKVITLVGTRFDESAERSRKMKDRGDSFSDISINAAGDRIISPIADWELDDVFFYIGKVRAERIESYSNFDALVDVYREINGGDCMVTVYATGNASKQPCGGRSGCFICLRAKDHSMGNMLKSPENAYMRPLHDFREFLEANQYDPYKRNWLSRTLNDDKTISIAPNAYSPAYCETLLRIVLTIQIRENNAAAELGIEPRFMLLRLKDVIAIELLWARYGYHTSAKALQIFDDVVVKGLEFDTPKNIPKHTLKAFPSFSATLPFVDDHFNDLTSGLRDVEAIVAGCERTVIKADGKIYSDVNTTTEFTVDEESVEMFFYFEYERFLERYSSPSFCPTQVFHYFMRLGMVSLSKGGHRENDRMLRMANQVHRKNLAGVLHDPELLVSALTGHTTSLAGFPGSSQGSLF